MISEAIIFRYGFREGLDIVDDVIVTWPYDVPQPTPQELAVLVAGYTFYATGKQYVEDVLLVTAQQRGYETVLSLCTYITSTNPLWQAEAISFVAWRDAVMNYALTAYGELLSGDNPSPNFNDFKNGLPTIIWPQH